ncbi:MAG: class I SAM-dependent methyltransferase [bacterium]|nr:class I SAM-dependent methyltransferase [bacterium]
MNFDEDQRRAFHEQNRRSWNAVTAAHNSHKRDQAEFLAAGGSTLFSDELELLGDVAGLDLVHLQCNCGQDSLALAKLGATVTGIDIGDEPIRFARELSKATGIAATFHRDDVFDWLAGTDARFDVAFASYGVIGWLCDLERWARGVARVLRPGGRLVLLEFHPLVWSYGPGGELVEPYFIDGAIDENGVNDYVGQELAPSGFDVGVEEFANPERSFGFQWTIARTIQAIIDSGLRLEVFREYPYANGCELFDGMSKVEARRFAMPEGKPSMPLMFGLVAGRAPR